MPRWNKEYYDILCFYFFEPQHLGRSKNPNTKIKTETDVINRLGRMEVALNHQLNYFFRLAPDAMISRLLTSVSGIEINDNYDFVGREFEARFQMQGATQPDIYLEGENSRISLELKLGAKSSLDQVAKYCLLHCHAAKKIAHKNPTI